MLSNLIVTLFFGIFEKLWYNIYDKRKERCGGVGYVEKASPFFRERDFRMEVMSGKNEI